METTVYRGRDGQGCTLGTFRVPNFFGTIFTMEPEEGKRIVPARYKLALTVSGRSTRGELWSPDPNHLLPEILGVVGHDGVRMHAGNKRADTVLCVLLANKIVDHETIADSRHALTDVVGFLKSLKNMGEECFVTFQDPA